MGSIGTLGFRRVVIGGVISPLTWGLGFIGLIGFIGFRVFISGVI